MSHYGRLEWVIGEAHVLKIDVLKLENEMSIWGCEPPETNQFQEARWPNKTNLGRAILAVYLRGGARDIRSSEELKPSNLQNRQYRHIFPVKILKKLAPNETQN